MHQLDERIVQDMHRFAERRFGAAPVQAVDVFEDVERAIQLASPWSVYCAAVEGRPIVDWYLDEPGRHLPPNERDWLEAQRRSWMTIWEVTDVEVGSTVTVRDLLAGEDRRVTEVKGSRVLVKRDAILGRVVDHAGLSVFCGIHPNPLPPFEAAEVLQRIRSKLRRKTAVPVERLRDDSVGRHMIRQWEDAVRTRTLESTLPPRLANTEGDELRFTTDVFTFVAARRAELERKLGAVKGVESPDGDDDTYTFVRGGGSLGGRTGPTVMGAARLVGTELHLETNSLKRADELRARVEKACAELVIHRRREHPEFSVLGPRNRPPGVNLPESPPAAAEAIREFKSRHYQDWVDRPLPALQGKTPREALRTPQGRASVEVLLKDLENHEGRQPAEARFDVATLRETMGLPG